MNDWYETVALALLTAFLCGLAGRWLTIRHWFHSILKSPDTKPLKIASTTQQLRGLLQGKNLYLWPNAACSVMISECRMILIWGRSQSVLIDEDGFGSIGFTTAVVITPEQPSTTFAQSQPELFRPIHMSDGKGIFWIRNRKRFLQELSKMRPTSASTLRFCRGGKNDGEA